MAFLTFLGVMNAADYYGLDELKQACSAFIESCITVDTVCALLATAERYIQYKCTKVLVQKVIIEQSTCFFPNFTKSQKIKLNCLLSLASQWHVSKACLLNSTLVPVIFR
jgi:hypothetical protein